MDILEIINKTSNYKSIEVNKDVDVEFDLGNMTALDSNVIDEDHFRTNADDCLKNLARDNAQLLVTQLWKLPTEQVDGIYVAKLPSEITRLPREKPVPAAKKATKWETFARMKGIQNKKKTRMVWDEQLKEYRPRWGYKRTNDDTKEWCHEVPDHADPFEDQFEKKMKAKKERIAKNELQRLRNTARNMKGKVPGLTLMPVKNPGKQELSTLQTIAKKSTASLGKFTESLPKEKPAKNLGKKRKFDSNFGDLDSERKKAKVVFERVKSTQNVVDKDRAANLVKADKETERSQKKKEEGGKERRSKKGHFKSKKNFTDNGQFPKGKGQGTPKGKPGKSGKGKPGKSSALGKGKPGKSSFGKGKPGKSSFGKGKPGKSHPNKGKSKSH